MKKLLTLTFAALFLLTLAACGGGNTTTPDEPPANNTPATTPKQNDPVVPPDNGGSSNGTSSDDNGNNGGNIGSDNDFFTGIDNAIVPDILKKIVGNLESADYNSGSKTITIVFTDCTKDNHYELRSHYESQNFAFGPVGSANDIFEMITDWGTLELSSETDVTESGVITVIAKLK